VIETKAHKELKVRKRKKEAPQSA